MGAQLVPEGVPKMWGRPPQRQQTNTQREYRRNRRFGKTKAQETARGSQRNSLTQTEFAKVMGTIVGSTTFAKVDSKHVGVSPPMPANNHTEKV